MQICRKCRIEKLIFFRKDSQKYRNECKQHVNDKRREWRFINLEKAKSCSREYFQQNKKEIKKGKIRRHMNTNCRLIHNLRSRNYKSLNGKSKSSSTKDMLGIDIDSFKKCIEYQFTPEMNWNYIEIDHVKPISLFDVSNNEESKDVFIGKTHSLFLKKVYQKVTKK